MHYHHQQSCLSSRLLYIVLFNIAVSAAGCIKPFLPPSGSPALGYLVIDGNISVGSETIIKLSRTKNPADSSSVIPEENAQLFIESESGSSYSFVETSSGVYNSEGASSTEPYRLRILTFDGNEYLSEYSETRVSPPIDSISWKEDKDIFIYVNTHDEENLTRYYRWTFDETAEFHAVFDSNIEFTNGQLMFIGPEEMRYTCFRNFPSSNVLIGSSERLKDDVITAFPLTRIPNDNSKIGFRYSILVRQQALTPEAYTYWQTLKRNSEQTGNIFDPQPSQLLGNFRNINNPAEPVIGYLSSSTISEKRLFISQSELSVLVYPDIDFCKEQFIRPESAADWLTDGTFLPAYYRMADGALAIAPARCVDCRLSGGTTAKPAFW